MESRVGDALESGAGDIKFFAAKTLAPGDDLPLLAVGEEEAALHFAASPRRRWPNVGKVFEENYARARAVFPGSKRTQEESEDPAGETDAAAGAVVGGNVLAVEPSVESAALAGAEEVGCPGKAARRALWRRPAVYCSALAGTAAMIVLGGIFVLGDGGVRPGDAGAADAAREPELVAPSAALAAVPPREPAAPAIREVPSLAEKGDLVEEIVGFGTGAVPAPPALRSMAAEADSKISPAVARAAGVELPPVAGGQQLAQVLAAPSGIPAAGMRVGEAVKAGPAAAAAALPPTAAKEPAGVSSSKAAGPALQAVAVIAADPPNPAAKESVGVSKLSVAVAPAGGGVGEPGADGEAARISDGRGGGAGRHLTEAQEREVLATVTELAALVRDTRAEIAALRKDEREMTGGVDRRLADFDRRVSMGEARRALDSAKGAAMEPPAAAPDPAAAAPLVVPGPAGKPPKKPGSKVAAMPPAAAAAPAGGQEAARRYRVQAASPGLAMLGEIDRTGDAGAQLQVSVGDKIAGYGRVTKIEQRGTAWVVVTESGAIQ